MRKITWSIDTGFVGARHEGELDVEDDATETEIEEMVLDELWNVIEWNWKEVSNG